MGIPFTADAAWKAYLPTLARDVAYGMARSVIGDAIARANPSLAKSAGGRFLAMFVTALCACILSSPGNELRGYYLQPPDRRQGFGDFFKPIKYVRSTAVGATNLAIALATGTLIVEPVKGAVTQLRSFFAANPVAALGLVLFLVHQHKEDARTAQVCKAHKDAMNVHSEEWKEED